MSWLPTCWIDRSVRFQQRRVLCLFDINTTVVDAGPVTMIGHGVDHLLKARINLTWDFDAISAKAGIRSQYNEVEHAFPKTLVEHKGRALDTIDYRYVRPPSDGGIRKHVGSTSNCKLAL